MAESLAFLRRHRWVWPLIGILILWAALTVLTSRFSLYSLSGIAISSSFLLLPAFGQMLVITTGRGNIDLSIPSTVTLAAYVSVMTSDGTNVGFALTLAAVLAIGLGVGLFNAFLVLVVRIPAMIATLASGYILATGVMIVNARIGMFSRAPLHGWLSTGRVGSPP